MAFDTIDHDLLLSRLTEWFGIDGVVLQWVRSYLTGRSQLVKINGVPLLRNCYCAVFHKALCWVHFFLLCILLSSLSSLSSIITAFGLKHHLYADDRQIYTSFVAEDITQSLIIVQNCMLAIQVWMDQNMLKLNPSKTELMIIGNSTQRGKMLIFSQLNF